ncbi:trypsin-like peptidase domain-containing protein [Myxococcus sp. Y35]|uniref:trypsin-like peptidase domain-containing protein n=1 Tax=Pseudomyxococcus flavus TaxID=3115648 RepID=UPI003CF39429
MKFTNAQYDELHKALLSAFPTRGDLESMLFLRVGKHLDQVALGDDLGQIVTRLIRGAEAQNWHLQLIMGAYEKNPKNPLLARFYERFFFLPSGADPVRSVERIVRSKNPFFDVGQFIQRARCVCRIESGGSPLGTGFLIGPDVVLTNHHVIRDLDERRVAGARISVVFDYQSLGDGRAVGPGKAYRLAEPWLLVSAPASPLDEVPEPKGGVPELEHLDFALLRVDGRPGREPVPGGERGWISLPEHPPEFVPGAPLCILQHPGGRPLQFALDPEAIVGLNENETRLRYTTNTLPGSSGSPCFDFSWDLIALHHSGDPALAPTYNEGIPIHTLRKYLVERGFGALVGVVA